MSEVALTAWPKGKGAQARRGAQAPAPAGPAPKALEHVRCPHEWVYDRDGVSGVIFGRHCKRPQCGQLEHADAYWAGGQDRGAASRWG